MAEAGDHRIPADGLGQQPGRVEPVHGRVSGTVIDREQARRACACRTRLADETNGLAHGFGPVRRRMRDAHRVENRTNGAAHRHLGGIPLAGVAAHADDDEHRDLVGQQERRDRVERVAEPARLQHHGRARPAEVQTGGDAERLFFPRRHRRADIRIRPVERREHVRQRIVRHVDDVTAADRVQAGRDACRPDRLDHVDRHHCAAGVAAGSIASGASAVIEVASRTLSCCDASENRQ